MARDREERKQRVVDAGRRLTEHSSGDRATLTLPAGLSLWQPKEGVQVIDVIPFEATKSITRFLKAYCEPGDLYYEQTYFQHERIGVNQDKVACPAKNFGHPCPICEYRIQKGNSPHKADLDMVKALKWKERQLFLVLDHAAKHKGVQLWEYSNWAFGRNLDSKINNASEKKKAKYRRFADPNEGFTLRLIGEKTAAGDTGGSYVNFTVDEFQERDDPIPEEVLGHGYDLSEMVREIPYPELQKMFLQIEDEDEVTNPPNKTTARVEGTPPKKKAEDDDDPPAKKPAEGGKKPVFKTGDTVTFSYKDTDFEGEVVKVEPTKEVLHIKCEGRDKPYVMDFEDVKVKGGGGKKPAPADDDDDPPPRRRPKEDDDEPPAKAKKPAPADDDDEPPAKKPTGTKPKASEWDDDEPPAKPAAKKPADDDDDPPFRPKPAARSAPDDDDDPPPRRTRR